MISQHKLRIIQIEFYTFVLILEFSPNMRNLLITISLLALFAMFSCDKDEPQLPDNALSLNMMSGDSNTTIGSSDVYINHSNNFTSQYYGIANLGNKGIDTTPNLSQIATEAAVTPGNYYQIIDADDVKIIAGERAIAVNSFFYNVYVDSWIYSKENNMAGAKIRYAEYYPETNKLPEWDATIQVKLKYRDAEEWAEYIFPEGCHIDSNYYFEYSDEYDLSETLNVKITDNRISFSQNLYAARGKTRLEIRVRYGNCFTRVSIFIESPD